MSDLLPTGDRTGRFAAGWAMLLILLVRAPLGAEDCNHNGVQDDAEITAGARDCNLNGVPDDCDLRPLLYGLGETKAYSLKASPHRVRAGDLNGDRRPDLIATLSEADRISVLINQGNGMFAPERSYDSGGSDPFGLALGDLDGDGDLDLVVANNRSQSLSFFLNQGDGVFGAPIVLADPAAPLLVDLVDLDGDGDLDLVGSGRQESLRLYENLGGGQFGPGASVYSGMQSSNSIQVEIRDLDGDGFPDLITGGAQDYVLSILRNDGHGKFKGPPKIILLGNDVPSAASLVAGDFDGDGKADLAFLSERFEPLSILLSDGAGGLQGVTHFPAGSPRLRENPLLPSLAAIDLDGNGDLDLVSTYWYGGRSGASVGVWTNRGGGRFAPAVVRSVSAGGPLTVADLNGDGRPDLVIANNLAANVTVIYGGAAAPYSTDCDADGIPDECEGDCDGDGIPDACEIASGKEKDCNHNGVPDSCELKAHDCDGDKILDDCAIAAGKAFDCNRNGIPDACDLKPVFDLAFAQELPVGKTIQSVEVGDLDGDGDLDLVTIDRGTDQGLIVFNQGQRRFSRVSKFDADGGWFMISLSDLDGDSRPDLVVADPNDRRVSVLRNRGDGAFLSPLRYPVGDDRFEAKVVDLDGDGAQDLVIAPYNIGDGSVFWGQGDGTFGPQVSVTIDRQSQLAFADLDGDHRLDIIEHQPLSSSNWRRNLGNRRFSSLQQLFVSEGDILAIADLDGNGKPDVVTALDDSVAVHLKALVGPGTEPVIHPDVGRLFAGDGAAVDLDGDGDLDLVAGLEVLINDGQGGFSHVAGYGSVPLALRVGDLDGDGRMDLVTVDSTYGGSIFVHWGLGDGRFAGAHQFGTGGVLIDSILATDLDGDGDLDLAISGLGARLLRNLGGSSYEKWFDIDENFSRLLVADLNGDGRLDLVTISTLVQFHLQTGPGEFGPGILVTDSLDAMSVVLADLDGDGLVDIAGASNGDLILIKNRGGGQFAAPATALTGGGAGPMVALDTDRDGDLDLAGVTQDPIFGNGVQILINQGDGTFSRGGRLAISMDIVAIAEGNLNGDGARDLVVLDRGGVNLYLNNGRGGFPSPRRSTVGENLYSGAIADMDGDGFQDLILKDNAAILVLRGRGDGSFLPPVVFHAGGGQAGLAVADLDGDGRPDVATDSYDHRGLTLIFNRSSRHSLDLNHDGVPDECAVRPRFHRGDPNGDGMMDISDGLYMLLFLFAGEVSIDCRESADANNDGMLDCSDAIFIFTRLFVGTAPPPDPGSPSFPCGTDPDPWGSPGDLGCERYERC